MTIVTQKSGKSPKIWKLTHFSITQGWKRVSKKISKYFEANENEYTTSIKAEKKNL